MQPYRQKANQTTIGLPVVGAVPEEGVEVEVAAEEVGAGGVVVAVGLNEPSARQGIEE